jgi:hypothetical protein
MKVVSPAPRDVWNEIVATDPDALAEHTPAWLDAMASVSGYRDASRLYSFEDGRRFVLPLARRGSGSIAPQSGYPNGWGIGGIVGAGLDHSAVSSIMADLDSHGSLYTHIRPNPLQADHWNAANLGSARVIPRRAHVIDLSGGAEATYQRFHKSGRTGVKRSVKAGVEVRTFVGGEHLDVYFRDLYLPSVERWAARQREPLALARFRSRRRDPFEKLHTIALTLGTAFRLYVAFVEGQPAAGTIVLFGSSAHKTRAALDYDVARNTSAAYAAEWAAIQDACQAGCAWYQMGESGQNTSLSEYKERFGAEALDYAEYRMERLPLLAVDAACRSVVKRAIGFRDV